MEWVVSSSCACAGILSCDDGVLEELMWDASGCLALLVSRAPTRRAPARPLALRS